MRVRGTATLIVGASLSFSLGCREAERGADTTITTAGDIDLSAAAVRVADITGDPDRFIGQLVTVVADVDEVIGTDAFVLDEDSPFSGGIDRDLTVLWPRSLALADLDDQWLNNTVRVTGTVRSRNVFEVEREIGWDLTSELEAELERKPVIVAQAVQRMSTGVTTQLVPVVAIVTAPASYAGRQVTGRARVGGLVSDRGFWVEQDTLRAFVILNETSPETHDIKPGQTVELTGTVYTTQMLDQLPGTVEPDARRVIERERAFIVVQARDFRIVGKPAPPDPKR